MAIFLNTLGLNQWIEILMEKAERELIIIVPYIKTSERVFNYLKEANDRGVHITLVYREDKLNEAEKNKLKSLKNLNLLHHPNVHAKCYLTEKYLIITSMNLYEYSEINNREMGVLMRSNNLDDSKNNINSYNSNDEEVISFAIEEIRQIINGANIEFESTITKNSGFMLELIKTEKERIFELCADINKVFSNKKFEPVKEGNTWFSMCYNYYDKINVVYAHRMELQLKMDVSKSNLLFDRIAKTLDEYMFDGFKVYWNSPEQDIYLYINRKDRRWKDIDFLQEVRYEKEGLDKLIKFIKDNLN